MKATAVCHAIPKGVIPSIPSWPRSSPTRAPIITAVKIARIPMVVYCLFRKAMAPSRIVAPISCIRAVPGSRLRTFLARLMAKIRAIRPEIGTIQTIPISLPPFRVLRYQKAFAAEFNREGRGCQVLFITNSIF